MYMFGRGIVSPPPPVSLSLFVLLFSGCIFLPEKSIAMGELCFLSCTAQRATLEITRRGENGQREEMRRTTHTEKLFLLFLKCVGFSIFLTCFLHWWIVVSSWALWWGCERAEGGAKSGWVPTRDEMDARRIGTGIPPSTGRNQWRQGESLVKDVAANYQTRPVHHHILLFLTGFLSFFFF